MLVAAAVCPCPPLLVPAVAAGAAAELAAARAACATALGVLAAAGPDRLIVVGPAGKGARGPYPQGTAGSFRSFGVDVGVVLGGTGTESSPSGTGAGGYTGDGRAGLPASLAVAAWLLEDVRWSTAPVTGLGVGEPLEAGRCIETGRDIGLVPDERVALLVMGDASACRTVKAPGYFDERAAGFDEQVAQALAAADVAALKALDAELAYDLKAAGRSSWQVLAGAAEGAGLSGRLWYEDAPYGVGYIVASWS